VNSLVYFFKNICSETMPFNEVSLKWVPLFILSQSGDLKVILAMCCLIPPTADCDYIIGSKVFMRTFFCAFFYHFNMWYSIASSHRRVIYDNFSKEHFTFYQKVLDNSSIRSGLLIRVFMCNMINTRQEVLLNH